MTLSSDAVAPDLARIEAAAGRLAGKAIRTPLIENHALNDRAGGRVFVKCENLQRTGSFKFRGAYNAIAQLNRAARSRGVVATSSGNHAQGVAAAAAMFGVPATIVMPSDAPRLKVARTEGHGATVRLYDRDTEDREAIAGAISADTGAVHIPPYDHPDVIAGQGTCGLEIADQLAASGVTANAVIVCCGGGGLTAGIATAIKAKSPGTRIHTAEPAGFDDTARSLAVGERVSNAARSGSICDAILVPTPGELTFAINRHLVESGLVVTDDEARDAVGFAFDELKLVAEPGGAVALAAVLFGKIETKGRVVALTISGGNVDRAAFCGDFGRADQIS